MSTQVNLHALNTLTAYISAFREIPPSPAVLVEFSQSTQDTQELSRKEARRIIRRYKKNLNDYRSGKIVYSSRTPSFSGSSSRSNSKSKSTSKSKSKSKTKSKRKSSNPQKRKTSSSLPVPSFDFNEVPDVIDLPSESGPAAAPTLKALNSPGAGGSAAVALPLDVRRKSKKKKKKNTRSKEFKALTMVTAETETEMVTAMVVLEEGFETVDIREEKQSALSNLWDTVCSLLAPPDIICYCAGTTNKAKTSTDMNESSS